MSESSIRDNAENHHHKFMMSMVVVFGVLMLFSATHDFWIVSFPPSVVSGGKLLFLASFCVEIVIIGYFLVKMIIENKKQSKVALHELISPKSEQLQQRVSVPVFVFFGLLQISRGLSSQASQLTLVMGIFSLVAALFLFISNRMKPLICPEGIWHGGLTGWDDIQKYEWDNLELWIRRKQTQKWFSEIHLAVTESQKVEVDQILREHIGQYEES